MKNLVSGPSTLMVVEDSDEDFEALLRILSKLGVEIRIQRCINGDECLAALGCGESSKLPLPCLILLDLNMPGTDGREALRAIKTAPHLKNIPVTVITTSASPRDVEACYAYGANAYVLKSLDYDDFMETVRKMTDFWLSAVLLPSPAY